MGLFSFTQEIAIDLGTANTVIIHNDKIVVDEPSVVALDKRTDKLLAVGEKARLMHGKTHENIRTIRPLRDGVIADFYAAEQMIRGMVKMVSSKSHWFSPSLRMVIGIPSGSTEVEIRAVRDSSEHAGGRDVYMIYEAKVLGASAVLLICSILSKEQLKEYRCICDELGLSALVEAHDEAEVEMAVEAGARMIGVNNRNLKDFSVDTENSRRLRSMIPAEVLFVSESGVRDENDVRKLREIGADAVLIGEALMRAEDKKAKLAALRG